MKPPVFKNGGWHYSRPSFDSIPSANAKVQIVSWPDGYEFQDGKLTVQHKAFTIQTPADCDRKWFAGIVQFLLGYNYYGWRYVV